MKPGHIIRPQQGPQSHLLASPAQEVFYGGARGGGKSHGILLDWINHYLQYPQHSAGVLFRRSYPELENIIDASFKLFPLLGGDYKSTKKTWHFIGGAKLKLRHLKRDSDAVNYQGHEYNWCGVDEAGSFPNPDPLWKIKATLRNVDKVPSRMVLTGNPGGVGQGWLKERYIAGITPYKLIPDEEDKSWRRTFIPAKVHDNKILMKNDPGYISRLKQVGADWLVKAWLDGDWDVVPGMYLEGVWNQRKHVVKKFDVPIEWRRWRALDWGFAKPYAVGWYAQDNDGVVYLYRELYGIGKKPNTGSREDASVVAKRIKALEAEEVSKGAKFQLNPADSSIWAEDGRFKSVNDIFLDEKVIWSRAAKAPGSRVTGAQEVIRRLNEGSFKVFNSCANFLRTVPSIPADEKHIEDVDTESEDHHWDQLRYSLMSRQPKNLRKKPSNKPKPGTMDWTTATSGPQLRDNPYANAA